VGGVGKNDVCDLENLNQRITPFALFDSNINRSDPARCSPTFHVSSDDLPIMLLTSFSVSSSSDTSQSNDGLADDTKSITSTTAGSTLYWARKGEIQLVITSNAVKFAPFERFGDFEHALTRNFIPFAITTIHHLRHL
jgi:hypothetical protein